MMMNYLFAGGEEVNKESHHYLRRLLWCSPGESNNCHCINKLKGKYCLSFYRGLGNSRHCTILDFPFGMSKQQLQFVTMLPPLVGQSSCR